jgi:polyvinyl alcohol dehydrogenase (cytochrome)
MSVRCFTAWRGRRLHAAAGLAALVVVSVPTAPGGTAPVGGARAVAAQSWPVAGQNIANTRDQAAESVISTTNVSQLKRKWTFRTAGDVSATPTMMNGVLYFPDMGGMLWAVAASGGRLVWSNPVASYTGIPGDVSRDSPAIYGDELITGDGWNANKLNAGAHVFAVDRTTGARLWSVQVDTDPASIITGSPTVYNGVVYVGVSSYDESSPLCCTFRGAVVALSAATGQILWKTYTVPSNNNDRDSNLAGYYSGGAVWGSAPVVNPATGLLYVATGDNYSVPAGTCQKPGQANCQPPVASDYFDSILALQLSTGAVAWDYHTVTADAYNGTCKTLCGPDDDFASSPNLITTTNPVTGAPEKLVGAGQKSGYYWALDPATGNLVWHTRIGPGGGGGGIFWGSATDGKAIYSAEADARKVPYTLRGSGPFAGQTITGGSWTAMDAATGAILWQTPDPQSAADSGYVSVADGVVYAGSNAKTGHNMYALDASNGAILWSFTSGGEVRSGAAIVGRKVYWGSGYQGGHNDKLYAFGLPAAAVRTAQEVPSSAPLGVTRPLRGPSP